MMRDVAFYLIATALLVSALATVTLRHLFHAALALLATLFASATLFLLLGAELVALGQVLVYIGGVMVFVLYAVFLTTDLGRRMPAPSRWKTAGALLTAGAVFALLTVALHQARALAGGAAPADFASLATLGARLLDPGPSGFLIPFEGVSVLLLAALVGALALARGLDAGGKGAKP